MPVLYIGRTVLKGSTLPSHVQRERKSGRSSLGLSNLIYIFVNNQPDAHFFFTYVYFYSLHVSGNHVPIIRRINCINTTSGICHSV
jgi:hypothetical protein